MNKQLEANTKKLLSIAARISKENPILGYDLECATRSFVAGKDLRMQSEWADYAQNVEKIREELDKILKSKPGDEKIIEFLDGIDGEVEKVKISSSRIASDDSPEALWAAWEVQWKELKKKADDAKWLKENGSEALLAEIDALHKGLDDVIELGTEDIEQIQTSSVNKRRLSSLIRFANAIPNSRQKLLPIIKKMLG